MIRLVLFMCYQLIQMVIIPLLPLYFIIRKIAKKSSIGCFRERFGWTPTCDSTKKIIWLHAVSVGEVLSIQTLIDEIQHTNNNVSCYLTCGTPSGLAIAREKSNAHYISFMPFDFLLPMIAAFFRIRPQAIIVVEAEWWPNLFFLSYLANIPLYLVNARIRDTNMKRYLKIACILRGLLSIARGIYTQAQDDKERFIRLGIDKRTIHVMGDIKIYNVFIKQERHTINHTNTHLSAKQTILLAGSIHPGEEVIYLNLFDQLKTHNPALKLIMAPRHFYWQDKLIDAVTASNHTYALWDHSSIDTTSISAQYTLREHDILLVCKLGELFSLYHLADIFFLGGTFVPVGGHNLAEPAAWAKLTIAGPYHENAKHIAYHLKKCNGLMIAYNSSDLLSIVSTLLDNKKQYTKHGIAARRWLSQEALYVRSSMHKLINHL